MRELILCETLLDVADSAAEFIFEAQAEAIEQRGVYRIALAGGNTPKALYEQLCSEEWIDEMQWDKWEVFWGDERAVPPEHPDSNYKLAHELWLGHVPVVDVWRMRGETENLNDAAAEYARLLKSRFGMSSPVLDTVILGMGTNGHIASLFPGHSALQSTAIVEAVEVNDPIRKRLTLTLPVINAARQVIFMVSGTEKAAMIHTILDGIDSTLPAALVQPEDGQCLWVIDQLAASKLVDK